MEKIRYRFVFNRSGKLNAEGKALVQLEARLSGKKIYMSTDIYLLEKEWNNEKRLIVDNPLSNSLNAWLLEFRMNVERCELEMWKMGVEVSLVRLREAVKGKRDPDMSFHQYAMSAIFNSTRTDSTKNNLVSTLNLLKEFRRGYSWGDITYSFVRSFECWLMDGERKTNTVGKHLRNLRTLVNEAIADGCLPSDKDPFRKFTIRQERTEHRCLTPGELSRIERLNVVRRLEKARDAFLFCCYTGFRFSDFKELRAEEIRREDGILWIKKNSKKTGCQLKIPLSMLFEGKAVDLITKWGDIESLRNIGSNADINRKLSEIGKLAKVNRKITFHVARHTCATLLIHRGVPITTVQRILGHSKISTTQIYSEVLSDTMTKDLARAGRRRVDS